MDTRCACLALCLFALPALSWGDSAPAAKETNESAAANAASAASAPPPTVAAPPVPESAGEAEAPRKPIKVGPYTLNTKTFHQKADTLTISGEIAGGRACGQLTVDFSLHNPVQPQDLILRETIENYDPKTPHSFERKTAAINDFKAWKAWKMAYVSMQCINNGAMNRYTAQPK